MILGNGDIASALTDRFDLLYFASGVSDSQCNDWKEFQREKELLLTQNKLIHVVYFSTLSIYYADTPYTRHKMVMESLVKKHFENYCIVRIGNINWGKNPKTLLNFLRNKISAGAPVEIKDEYRYILNKDEFRHWLELIPDFSTEMNIPGNRQKVKDIIYCLTEKKYQEYAR